MDAAHPVNDTTCGGTQADNNVWGHGRLDASTAVYISPRGPVGRLTGTIRDASTGQPVSGALVTFSVRNGRAAFSGARAITVATNAAGRAVATGFTPTGAGALQIGASAAFEGQTAVATGTT